MTHEGRVMEEEWVPLRESEWLERQIRETIARERSMVNHDRNALIWLAVQIRDFFARILHS